MGKATVLKAIILVAGIVFLGAALASVLEPFLRNLMHFKEKRENTLVNMSVSKETRKERRETVKVTMQVLVLLLLAILLAGSALAQELMIYPSQGQSQDQIEKDKFECYQWAKQQTGFDPMQAPQATAPPPQQQAKQGGVVRGAARGAAVGTVVGGIAGGEWGKGAAAGAAGGALLGGMRRQDQRRQQQQAQKQWEEQQVAEYTQKRNAYDRAYSACLEGKGYTVK